MKEYFEHLFSRKEEAGRQEMIALTCLYGLLPVGLGLFALLIVMFFDFLFIGSETGFSPWIFLTVIYGAGAAGLAVLSFAALRRLKNIGLPNYLAYLLIVLLIPYLNILGLLFLIFLMICPPLKNPHPQPYTPVYFKQHLRGGSLLVLVPAILVMGLSVIIGDNTVVFSSFPVLRRWYKVQQPRPQVEQTPQEEEDEIEPEEPEEVSFDDMEFREEEINLLKFPMYTDPDLIVRYSGQNLPAYVSGQVLPNENNQGDFALHLTWEVPDTMPLSDRTAWDTEKLRSCGEHCKQMPSVDGKKVMRISLNQKQNLWIQSVGRKEGLIEYISFSHTTEPAWQEFTRYRDNKRVQSFVSDKTSPATVRFFDIGLQNGVLFPLNGETLWLIISPDGSISPVAIQNNNPDVLIHFPREEFAQTWLGVHPSTKWLDLMFPRE